MLGVMGISAAAYGDILGARAEPSGARASPRCDIWRRSVRILGLVTVAFTRRIDLDGLAVSCSFRTCALRDLGVKKGGYWHPS